MRLGMAVLSVIMMALMVTSASATVRIVGDPGGQIGPYMDHLATLRSSGEKIVIDGPCLSACTMILGLIPREQVCATPRAKLGFHAAWHPDGDGRPITSRGGTQLLMDVYPQQVKKWIARRGGLTPQMKYLAGRELYAMVPPCP